MAEDNQDTSQKTEEPTQLRLDQAREKGQVAKSQEINHWFMILAMTIIIGVFGESLLRQIAASLYRFVERPHAIRIDSAELRDAMVGALANIALAAALPIALILLAAALAGTVQNGLIFSAETIKPKLEKLSLIKGAKRLFSSRSIVEFAKGIAKIAIVSAVLVVLVWPEVSLIPNITGMSLGQVLHLLQSLTLKVLIGVLSVMTVIAALDYLYQRHQHTKQLRMSKQELKEEFKQTEGDPVVKSRLRQIRMERARKRMMAAVPEADVVITNPTHYSVALKYDPAAMEAPVLVAKGTDTLAMRIREIARENDVPVLENPPLTRALYEGVELDQPIPSEHYKAVAEVIGYVMRLKGKLPPAPGARTP